MKKLKPFYRQALPYFFLLIIALLFAAVFHFSISPVVTEEIESDVSCFHVIGKAMLSGKMPYLDFIDNKGPVLYFIYMFSSLIFDFPWGIFLISTILNFCSLILLDNICKRLKIPNSFWILLLYLFFYTCVCSNGGLTEDFSLPLTMAAFLIYLDFDESLKNNRLRFFTGFLMGLLFWLCAFTRVNNALSIALITVLIGIQLLLKKEFKKVAAFVGTFAAGSVIVVLPIVLWLGRNGAFQEFLTQSLLNNFMYSSSEDAISKVDLFFHNRFGMQLFFLVIESILGCVIFLRRCGKKNLPVFITTLVVLLGTAASFVSMTQDFQHYLLVILIPAFFGFILQYAHWNVQLEQNAKRNIFIVVTTIVCCIGMFFTFSGKLKVESGYYYARAFKNVIIDGSLFQKTEYEQNIDRWAEQIPRDERDSVYSIDANPKFYAYSGITPCKRMFVCQSLFTGISKNYYDEFVSYFSNDPPKWLITQAPLETLDICGIGDALTAAYHLVDGTSGIYYLYTQSEPNDIN